MNTLTPTEQQAVNTHSHDDIRNVLQPFGKWLRENYKQIDVQVWLKRFTGTMHDAYTFNELIEQYISEQLNKQQDGNMHVL